MYFRDDNLSSPMLDSDYSGDDDASDEPLVEEDDYSEKEEEDQSFGFDEDEEEDEK